MSRQIVMFVPQFLPLVGGAERQTHILASALISLGLKVEVVTLQFDRRWPLREEVAQGLFVNRVPYTALNRRDPWAKNLGLRAIAILTNLARITSVLNRQFADFDVLHAHNAQSPLTAWVTRCARRLGLATVVKVANTGEWFDLRVLRKHRIWGRRSVRWLMQNADCWQAISHSVVDELRSSGIAQAAIVHVPNGVQLPPQAVVLPRVASRFLYLGRLAVTAPRDVVGLISAFGTVAKGNPAAELALVGGGDRLAEIRAILARAPSGERVYSPGEGPSEPWLRWAHCLVQPSFFEGMSNALLEAMAAGLACVAYDIQPNREALDAGDAGVLVPVGDRDRLASALSDLGSTDGLARELGVRARRRVVTTYEITLIARRIATVYETISGAPQEGPDTHRS